MRIGIFTQCYHPTLNGVVVSIDTFRKDLEKMGHQYFIFAPRSKGFEEHDPRVFRYPSFRWPGQSYYPIALYWLAPLQTKRIKDLNLDLIHSQHLFTMGNLGLKQARTLDIPLVHTYHTLIEDYTHYVPLFSEVSKKIVVNMSRNYCNNCDQIVTPSKAMKKVLRSYDIKVPIEDIPTGVDLESFKNPYHQEILRAKWQIPDGKKILLYVSRIGKEKNLDLLFEAIRILVSRRLDFHLLLVGGGPELASYQKKVEGWNLEAVVTFAGMQPPSVTHRIFGAADIFVFPSITETQGIVVTEAMAAGLPVVAVNIMGPSNIIENGVDGFLVPNNKEEFAKRVEKLLENEDLRRKMSQKGRQNAEKYSTLNSAKKLEKLYEETIASYRS